MPNPTEWCEVTANGQTYRDWLGVTVQRGFADHAGGFVTFSVQLAEPNVGGKGKVATAMQLAPGDDVEVTLAGKKVVANGKVITRQAAYDANRHGVRIDGRSRAADITDSSVEIQGGGQYRNYPLSAIANSVLKPLGLRLNMKNAPPGAEKPFDSVMVQHGETVFEFIERLARQRDCYIWEDEDGSLNAGLPDGAGGATLEEGVNIVSAQCVITDPHKELIVRGQDIGSDDTHGKQVSQVSAKGTVAGARNDRKLIILAEEPITKDECKMRCRRDVRELSAMAIQLTVVHQGWFKPGGGWWDLGEMATVKSPMVIPAGHGSMELKVFNIVWAQDAENATTTTVTFVTQAAFARSMGESLKPDGFAPGGGPEPEIQTPR